LETVQETREPSIWDHRAVQETTVHLGYPETMVWVLEHQQDLVEEISSVFVAAE
jgi:hypothetical protein